MTFTAVLMFPDSPVYDWFLFINRYGARRARFLSRVTDRRKGRVWWWRMGKREARAADAMRDLPSERMHRLAAIFLRYIAIGCTVFGDRFEAATVSYRVTVVQQVGGLLILARVWLWRRSDWRSVRPQLRQVCAEITADASRAREQLGFDSPVVG